MSTVSTGTKPTWRISTGTSPVVGLTSVQRPPVFESIEGPWPLAALQECSQDIAFDAWQLLLNFSSWVHRRVERIEFLDDRRVRRHVSVDFTLPPFIHPAPGPSTPPRTLVPLGLLRKGPLRRFDIVNEGREALSLLTKEENTLLATTMLIGLASTAVDDKSLGLWELSGEALRDLHAVAGDDLLAALAARDRFERGSSFQHTWIGENELAAPLIKDLSTNFVMFTLLRAVPGQRRLVKFAYEDDLPLRVQRSVLTATADLDDPKASRYGKAGFSRRAVGAGYILDIAAVGAAESYHVELSAPRDVGVAFAALHVDGADGGSTIASYASGVETAHLHTSDHPREAQGQVEVHFAPRPEGLLTETIIISAITAIVLGGGLVLRWRHVAEKAEIAALLIVVLPGIFATYLARSDEHLLAATLTSRMRIAIAAVALSSFGAAVTLAIDIPSTLRIATWLALFVVCAGTAVSAYWLRRFSKAVFDAVR